VRTIAKIGQIMSFSDANLQLEQLHAYTDARKSRLCGKLRLLEHRKCGKP
jgi:hypothetical protein